MSRENKISPIKKCGYCRCFTICDTHPLKRKPVLLGHHQYNRDISSGCFKLCGWRIHGSKTNILPCTVGFCWLEHCSLLVFCFLQILFSKIRSLSMI